MIFEYEKQIKELEDRNKNLKFWNKKQSETIEGLRVENQSLHDQITEMEAERIKIYQFAAKAKVAISNIQAT